ncbi:T9SS type A sorting domain-containing protein [Candidatus Woesearchaeota archaeon]|nr:T9SS type A sorting domain-containing protein [Candidatus Woesearchaeota archaeon]
MSLFKALPKLLLTIGLASFATGLNSKNDTNKIPGRITDLSRVIINQDSIITDTASLENLVNGYVISPEGETLQSFQTTKNFFLKTSVDEAHNQDQKFSKPKFFLKHNNIYLQTSFENIQSLSFKLFNTAGRLMQTQHYGTSQSLNIAKGLKPLSFKPLKTGVYFLTIQIENQSNALTISQPFMVVNDHYLLLNKSNKSSNNGLHNNLYENNEDQGSVFQASLNNKNHESYYKLVFVDVKNNYHSVVYNLEDLISQYQDTIRVHMIKKQYIDSTHTVLDVLKTLTRKNIHRQVLTFKNIPIKLLPWYLQPGTVPNILQPTLEQILSLQGVTQSNDNTDLLMSFVDSCSCGFYICDSLTLTSDSSYIQQANTCQSLDIVFPPELVVTGPRTLFCAAFFQGLGFSRENLDSLPESIADSLSLSLSYPALLRGGFGTLDYELLNLLLKSIAVNEQQYLMNHE